MTLENRWRFRQAILDYLASFVSLTTCLLILIFIKFWKLKTYGLSVYPDATWPTPLHLEHILGTFWSLSVFPLVKWIPVTVALDRLLHRFVLRIDK